MGIGIFPLDPVEQQSLRAAFEAGTKVMGVAPPFSMPSVQQFYDHCLEEKLTGNPTIVLGLCFGAVIASRTGYEWVRGEDENGSETGLAPVGKTIFIAPITMLQKQLRLRDRCNLEDLAHDTILLIDNAISEGTVADRW
jgi:hypothetical protein